MSKQILMIDDEPDIVTLVTGRLKANGLDVVSASDGEKGLAKVQEIKPALIILDVMMPNMDGFTFMQELKKIDDCKDIPVIVLTAKGDMEEIFKMEGVVDYIVKSSLSDELIDKVKKHIS